MASAGAYESSFGRHVDIGLVRFDLGNPTSKCGNRRWIHATNARYGTGKH